MQRRTFVAGAGGTLAALTGCLGGWRQSDGSPPTGNRTATPTRTDEPAAGVTVDSLHLQYGVVTLTTPDSIGVSNPAAPYLVASVRVDGPLSWAAFGLGMADVRYVSTGCTERPGAGNTGTNGGDPTDWCRSRRRRPRPTPSD